MTRYEVNYIDAVIDNEGFDYAFIHYTDFENINDSAFHAYRLQYIEARKQLIAFLKEQGCMQPTQEDDEC